MDLHNPYLDAPHILPGVDTPAFGQQFMTANGGGVDDEDDRSGIRSNWTTNEDNKG